MQALKSGISIASPPITRVITEKKSGENKIY